LFANVVANLDTNRTQMPPLVTSSQSGTGALQAAKPVTSYQPCWPSNSLTWPQRSRPSLRRCRLAKQTFLSALSRAADRLRRTTPQALMSVAAHGTES
jgi:hypothetical protein